MDILPLIFSQVVQAGNPEGLGAHSSPSAQFPQSSKIAQPHDSPSCFVPIPIQRRIVLYSNAVL